MIPKKIHYCWFGQNPKPKSVLKCIDSWKKYCPDYEIIEWNEDNFDVNMNGYTKMCYDLKKYAFLSDYVRLFVIEQFGGIYFDTDVEVIKSMDFLLSYDAFYCFETAEYVNTGEGFGSTAHSASICAMISEYNSLLDGTSGTQGCPVLNSAALEKLGMQRNGVRQTVANAIILPSDYMNPFDPATGKLTKTENTISIHWYSAAWLSPWRRLRTRLMRPIHRIFGKEFFRKLR